MSRRTVRWLSIVGSIASVIGVALYFLPSDRSSAPSQSVHVAGSESMGVIAGRDVTVTVTPQQPEPPKFRQPAPLLGEIDYRKLASPAFSRQFVGQTVTFRAVFLSEWSEVAGYSLAGISTKNLVFLNHRGIDYAATRSPLGSSDSEFPPFPLSVSANQVDMIYNLRKGDFVLVKGQVEQPQPQNTLLSETLDFAKIYIHAIKAKKLSIE
jgi:hypothetical protein